MSRPAARVVVRVVIALAAGASVWASAADAFALRDARAAEPDTALGRYLGTLSDSTDRYFGVAAAPVDTAGLDTALADSGRPRRAVVFGVLPAFSFTRVDGPVPGVSASVSGAGTDERRGLGRLSGKLAYAMGSDAWMGHVDYAKRLEAGAHALDVRLWGGRATTPMNRDREARYVDTWRAFVWGGDAAHYLRHDGVEAELAHDAGAWRGALGFRDVLETPRAVTASWDVLHRKLVVPFNLAAARGRTHELALEADGRWRLLRGEVRGWLSNDALGSDFDYRRVRVAAGAELPWGGIVSLTPQVAYGRLNGDALPQDAFYLGGGAMLRSLPRDDAGGTTLALARVDALLVPDLLTVLHVKHSASLPVQLGAFAGSGAVRGPDPYGGGGAPGDWPQAAAWRSELGVSLQYDSALLQGGSFLRASVAWPVGANGGPPRLQIGLARALDLLRPISE